MKSQVNVANMMSYFQMKRHSLFFFSTTSLLSEIGQLARNVLNILVPGSSGSNDSYCGLSVDRRLGSNPNAYVGPDDVQNLRDFFYEKSSV